MEKQHPTGPISNDPKTNRSRKKQQRNQMIKRPTTVEKMKERRETNGREAHIFEAKPLLKPLLKPTTKNKQNKTNKHTPRKKRKTKRNEKKQRKASTI